jgi:thiol-disulfide isomerase/thioredoxin
METAMLRFGKLGLFWIVFSMLIVLPPPWACGQQADKKAEKPKAETPVESAVDLDNVPDGAVEELMAYLKKVMAVEPKDMDHSRKILKTLIKTTDKILDANPGEKDLKQVVALRMDLPMTADEYAGFADRLTKVGQAYLASDKPELGRDVISIAHLVRINAARGDREDFRKAVDAAIEHLRKGKLQRSDLMLVLKIAQAVDRSSDAKFAAETVEKLLSLVKESKLDKVEEIVKNLEGTLRRLKLVGNRIELEGVLLSGGKFDMSKYQGKVVLVCFWAPWCETCMKELPLLKKLRETYGGKGVEVIGVSVEKNREAVEKFVEKSEIPWPIILGDNGVSTAVEYYGISEVPIKILVDKNGKVLAVFRTADELEKLLQPDNQRDKSP